MIEKALQREACFRLNDSTYWYPDEARCLVSTVFEGNASEELLCILQHSERGGNYPSFRFKGGEGQFSIVALGSEASDVLERFQERIQMRLHSHLNQPVRLRERVGWATIAVSDSLRYYRAQRVVFARKHKHMSMYFDLSDSALKDHLRSVVCRGLKAQAYTLGLEHPNEEVPLQILNFGRRVRIPITQYEGIYAGATAFVDFATNLQLGGDWAVGGLMNKGNGRIKRIPSSVSRRLRSEFQFEVDHAFS